MSAVNYKKWDHLEVSDDEDDTHPNIDTPSLFRWRHQARVERMEAAQKEKEEFERDRDQNQKQLEAATETLKKMDPSGEKYAKLKAEVDALEVKRVEIQARGEEIAKKERLTPLNIDTICHEGKSRTMINKEAPFKKVALTPEEEMEAMQRFREQHYDQVKRYGFMQKIADTRQLLHDAPHLVCEYTANLLVLDCITYKAQDKAALSDVVAHQIVQLQFLLKLAEQMNKDPKALIDMYFNKMKENNPEHMQGFHNELSEFKERVRKRAEERLEEARLEVEAEEREKRLGPGGLDPVEVFASLPKELQDCFASKDTEMLKVVVDKMDKAEANAHMTRCVDAGMWLENTGGTDAEDDGVYQELPEEGQAQEATTAGQEAATSEVQEGSTEADGQGNGEAEEVDGVRKRAVAEASSTKAQITTDEVD